MQDTPGVGESGGRSMSDLGSWLGGEGWDRRDVEHGFTMALDEALMVNEIGVGGATTISDDGIGNGLILIVDATDVDGERRLVPLLFPVKGAISLHEMLSLALLDVLGGSEKPMESR